MDGADWFITGTRQIHVRYDMFSNSFKPLCHKKKDPRKWTTVFVLISALCAYA